MERGDRTFLTISENLPERIKIRCENIEDLDQTLFGEDGDSTLDKTAAQDKNHSCVCLGCFQRIFDKKWRMEYDKFNEKVRSSKNRLKKPIFRIFEGYVEMRKARVRALTPLSYHDLSDFLSL